MQQVASLSVLELSVLVAAERTARCDIVGSETIFERFWEVYTKYTSPHPDHYSKDAALRAWDRLPHIYSVGGPQE